MPNNEQPASDISREERVSNAVEIALDSAHACGQLTSPRTAGQSFSDRFLEVLDCYYTPILRRDERKSQGKVGPAAPRPTQSASTNEPAGQTSLGRWTA